MPRYSHAFDLGFEVTSQDPKGEDVTPAMLREALMKRIASLDASPEQQEWVEATGAPFDSYEIEEEAKD